MTDFFEVMDAADTSDPTGLRELWLGTEPAMLVLFTTEVEEIRCHWEPSEEFRTNVVCPGPGCPLCYIKSAPQRCTVLPVYNLEAREVQVLRIPVRKGVGSLAAAITPALRHHEPARQLVILQRQGNRYSSSSRRLPDGADNGAATIAQFIAARDAGLKLVSAFQQPAAAELAAIERIRSKLDAIGGYSPPAVEPPAAEPLPAKPPAAERPASDPPAPEPE